MARSTLIERRRLQTRDEIAKSALALFAHNGYDKTSVEAISDDAGVSLRTFYRYFSTKEEVLSPLVTGGTLAFVERLAARPPREGLVAAVRAAYEEVEPRAEGDDPRPLISLLMAVPALHSRWLNDLRTIEDALMPVVRQRAGGDLSDERAYLTAATIVTALRVVLESSARAGGGERVGVALGEALRYLRAGAKL